jgi:uncharacterized membrane protein
VKKNYAKSFCCSTAIYINQGSLKKGRAVIPVLAQYLSVYLLGIFELWVAIPAGIAFNFPVIATVLVSAAGAITSGLIVCAAGVPIRTWLMRMKTKKTGTLDGNILKIWKEFGIVGLGLIAPFFTGVHIGTAIAIALGCTPRKTMAWMTIGTVVWSFIIAYAAAAGFSFFR